MTASIGTFRYPGQIERAAMATLQKWMRTHLGLIEVQLGFDAESLEDVHSWARRTSVDLGPRPHEHTPVVALAAGPTTSTDRDGDGSYDAAWDLQVAVIVASSTEEDTRDKAGIYAAAVRSVLVQHPWEQLPVACRWTGEQPHPVDTDHQLVIAGMSSFFTVYTDGVLTTDAGPTTPEPLPDPPGGGRPDYPDAPTAETVHIAVEQTQE